MLDFLIRILVVAWLLMYCSIVGDMCLPFNNSWERAFVFWSSFILVGCLIVVILAPYLF